MNHKRMSAENYNNNNGQARGNFMNRANFSDSFTSPNVNVFNPNHDWNHDSMNENAFGGHNFNRKTNGKYQGRAHTRNNFNKSHRNFNANRNTNYTQNQQRIHENIENQAPEATTTDMTELNEKKCFNETLSDDSIMCQNEKDISNGSNEYVSHLKTENTSMNNANDNSSGFGESHSSGVSIADMNNNYQEHVLNSKDDHANSMYIDVNSTPQMSRQPLGELNPNNLSYDYEYGKNAMNMQSQGSPYYIWPAANNQAEYVSPQQSQPMAAFYQPYPTMPCVYGPIETNYASGPATQPYSPIQNSATSAFASNLGSSPNVYISQQQYLATPPNPTSTLNNSPTQVTMIPSQMSYPMYSSSYPSPIPAVVPIGAPSMSSPMPSYLMTPPMSQCSASPKQSSSTYRNGNHHGKRNNYHNKKSSYNKTAYNNYEQHQAYHHHHHQDYYYNSQPSDQTYLINNSFNDINSTNNSLDDNSNNNVMMAPMDNTNPLNTSASNINMIPMNPHDLAQSAPQFIYPNTIDGNFEYNENYNYSFGDDDYGDESKLEPVDDDSQLACRICRGRRMCFCYFLKVRYYKFPSFLDLVDHQYKKWRSSVVKSKKL